MKVADKPEVGGYMRNWRIKSEVGGYIWELADKTRSWRIYEGTGGLNQKLVNINEELQLLPLNLRQYHIKTAGNKRILADYGLLSIK